MIALAAATLVVCAPGSPGSSGEARPAMDALARALVGAGRLPAGPLCAGAPGLPRQVEIQAGSGVLSALRRAADGEKVAVLLDGAQAAALGTLPFASSLAVVETSPRMPVAVVATVGKRMQEGGWKALAPAFTRLADDPAA